MSGLRDAGALASTRSTGSRCPPAAAPARVGGVDRAAQTSKSNPTYLRDKRAFNKNALALKLYRYRVSGRDGHIVMSFQEHVKLTAPHPGPEVFSLRATAFTLRLYDPCLSRREQPATASRGDTPHPPFVGSATAREGGPRVRQAFGVRVREVQIFSTHLLAAAPARWV